MTNEKLARVADYRKAKREIARLNKIHEAEKQKIEKKQQQEQDAAYEKARKAEQKFNELRQKHNEANEKIGEQQYQASCNAYAPIARIKRIVEILKCGDNHPTLAEITSNETPHYNDEQRRILALTPFAKVLETIYEDDYARLVLVASLSGKPKNRFALTCAGVDAFSATIKNPSHYEYGTHIDGHFNILLGIGCYPTMDALNADLEKGKKKLVEYWEKHKEIVAEYAQYVKDYSPKHRKQLEDLIEGEKKK